MKKNKQKYITYKQYIVPIKLKKSGGNMKSDIARPDPIKHKGIKEEYYA